MERDSAHLKSGDVVAQRFEEVPETFEERIQPWKRVKIFDNRLCHGMHHFFLNSFVRDDHVDDGDLRGVLDNAAERSFL